MCKRAHDAQRCKNFLKIQINSVNSDLILHTHLDSDPVDPEIGLEKVLLYFGASGGFRPKRTLIKLFFCVK